MKNTSTQEANGDIGSSLRTRAARSEWRTDFLRHGSSRSAAEALLKLVDIEIDGGRPWDVQVKDSRLFDRVLVGGSLALGESYMDGWWDCPSLDELSTRLLRGKIDEKVWNWNVVYHYLRAKVLNRQSRGRSFAVAKQHYNIGNDLYRQMLDQRMIYSCGYWKAARNLDEAQEAKLDLICHKMGFEPGMKILDIGCGWGGFLKYACEKYGVTGVGLTVSEPQAAIARENCSHLPVEIQVKDYRDFSGRFDRVVSIGMFEHVGYKNYKTFFDVCYRCLDAGGLMLLHTIGSNQSVLDTDPWLDKYIFPNGMLPSVAQIGDAIESTFVMEDWHNFGADYDKTLMAWFNNFDQAWPGLSEQYGTQFYRMWKYYLLMCAGSFRVRKNQLWQIVLSKQPQGGYVSLR